MKKWFNDLFLNFQSKSKKTYKAKGKFYEERGKNIKFSKFSTFVLFREELLNGSTNGSQNHRTNSSVSYYQVFKVRLIEREIDVFFLSLIINNIMFVSGLKILKLRFLKLHWFTKRKIMMLTSKTLRHYSRYISTQQPH